MRLPIVMVGLFAATAAVAQDAPPRPMMSDACRAEIQKLCPVAADGDRRARMQCVMASQDKLSDGCKKEMADMRAARAKMRAERGGDMTPPPGDGAPPPQ